MKPYKKPFIRLNSESTAIVLAMGMLAVVPAHATTYQWNGATSTAWSTSSNWSSPGIAPTGITAGHRLSVNSAVNNEAVYSAAQGTTVYGADPVAPTYLRGLVIGSGTLGNGALRITGGTFSSAGNATYVDATNRADVIGNSGKTGTLTIDGGNYITGVSGVRFGISTTTDGTTGIITINSGSMDAASIRSFAANGTVNLNGGTSTVGYVLREAGTATVNFNGGTLRAKKTTPDFIKDMSALNVLSGGAVIDTNGFDVDIVGPLLDGGGGGGLVKNGTGKLYLNGAGTFTGGTTINGGTLSLGNTGALGAGPIANNATLSINSTIAKTLANEISGTGGVSLVGSGAITLTGAKTYTGTTTVNAGTLILDGSLASNIIVASSANLAGEGSTTGSLAFNGTSNLTFDTSTGSALTAASVDASGASVSFIPLGAIGPVSNIVVMEAAGGITGTIGTNFLENTRISLSFNGGNTQLLANYTPGSLVWKGDSSADWDTATPNWQNTGDSSTDIFVPGDAVVFNDNNTFESPVYINLHDSLIPGNVTFANDTKDYDLTGISGGRINGTTSVVMNGDAKVVFNTTNTYSGGTTINSGTVEAKVIGALGTGPVTVATGATLNLTWPFNAANGETFGYTGISTALSGGGTVNMTLGSYDDSLNFYGDNSGFTGTMNIGIGAVPGASPPATENLGSANAKARLDSPLNAAATVNVLAHGTAYVGNVTAPITQSAAVILNGGDTGESMGQLRLDRGCIWSGPVTLAGDITGTGDGHIGSYDGRNGTISGTIGETGGSRALVKAGGGYIVLSGNNTYTGETRIIAGALLVTGTSNLGTTGAGTTVGNNASLGLSGSITYPAGESLTITGPGVPVNGAFAFLQRGALQSVSGDNTWPGDITVAAGNDTNNRFGVQDGAQLTLSGTITEGSAGRIVIFRHGQTDGSNIIVSGTGNHWTGETQIFGGAGAVILGVDNAFPPVSHLRVGTASVPGQSNLDLNGHSQACAGLSRVGVGAAFITNNGAAPSMLTITPQANLNWAGVIQDGASSISVVKNGSNIQVFSGINTYTGPTTVNAGVLQVTGQLAVESTVTVGGATATGTPTLTGYSDGGSDGVGDWGIVNGPLTISAANGGAAGIVNPGTVGTIGTLHSGNTTIAGTYACDVNATTSDVLDVNGDLDLTGAALALNELAAPGAFPYPIISYTGTLTGTFAQVPSGYSLDYSTPGVIHLVQSSGSALDSWLDAFFPPGTDPALLTADADPDGDGSTNLAEFGFNGNPLLAGDHGMVRSITADSDFDGDTTGELVLTIAVRAGAPVFSGSPSPSASIDGIEYTVEGGTTLGSFTTTVNVVPTPVITGLPATPGAGYEWRSFSLGGSNGLTGRGFLRAKVRQP